MAVHELLRRPIARGLALALLVGLQLVSPAPLGYDSAQAAPYGPFNRADEDWRVYETKYFRFYSSPSTQRTLQYLTEIGDGIYEELNAFYGYQPKEKLTVTIIGFSGYANGFAEYTKNRITIFPTPPNFVNRSRMPWLKNVFTHELSHILSLNTASASLSKIPLALATGIVRHTVGVPIESSIRIPFAGGNNPHWYREGIAQFDTARLGYDGFDENRRAYQRANWEDDRFFAMEKLAFFGGEKWYNGGFGFLLYLEELFGRDAVHDLTKAMGSRYYYRFEDVFEDVFGASFEELESTYRQRVGANYAEHRTKAKDGTLDGTPINFESTETPPYRELSPEERGYLYHGYRATPVRFHEGRFFYRQGSIVHHGQLNTETKLISDTKSLGVAQAIAPRISGSYFVLKEEGQSPSPIPFYHRPSYETSSLFLVDDEGNDHLLASEARLHDIDTCKAQSLLAAVYNDGDGSMMLALYQVANFSHSDPSQVSLGKSSFPIPIQSFDEVGAPRFSPDCKRLYFSRRVGNDHDLMVYHIETKLLDTVAGQDAFELYPSPTDDGVYFVSARDGSMSVYFEDLDPTTDPVRVTHALTAHHYPVTVADGVVVGRLYSTGLHLHHQPFTAPPVLEAAAEAKPVPVALRALIVKKVMNLLSAALPISTTIEIAPSSASDERADIAKAFSDLGFTSHVPEDSDATPQSLRLVYLLDSSDETRSLCDQKEVLCLGNSAESARRGHSDLAVGSRQNKPQIFLNLGRIQTKGIEAAKELIDLSEVVMTGTTPEPTPLPPSQWPTKPTPSAESWAEKDSPSTSYWGLANMLSPSLVPILYFELDTDRSYGASMRVQGGLELYMEDQLRQHAVLIRGFAGARSSVLASYRNRTTPVTLYISGGMTKIKSLYSYETGSGSGLQTFERVADYNWGFYTGSASLPLNLFHYLTLSTSTILDTGSILGGAEPPFGWTEPRYSRTLSGLTLSFVGLDKSSPNFSQREINKRGYRKFDVRIYHGREYSHPYLARYDENLGKTINYVRAEGSYTEYIALPKLDRGWFDHTLQVDLHLGYITENVNFLPFIGGGRLYSLTAPELNTSVGFVGYDFYSITGETVLNLGLTYRFPLARQLGWSAGPIFVEDLYAQVFTSWGNIWGYNQNADGSFSRQIPFVDAAPNGQHILGDVGVDLRFGHFFQELDANFGTTLRAAYRLIPFSACPYDDVNANPNCLDDGGRRALSVYLMVGGGF